MHNFRRSSRYLNSGGCLGVQIVALIASAPLLAQDQAVTPLPIYNDVLSLPLSIAGTNHIFLLESTTSSTWFDSSMEPLLGKTLGEGRSTGNASKAVNTFNMPEASIGSVEIEDSSPVGLMDLSLYRAMIGRKIDGALGLHTFTRHVIQIDFDKSMMDILPVTARPSEEWGEGFAVADIDSASPAIEFLLNNHIKRKFVVDTGNLGSVLMSASDFDACFPADEPNSAKPEYRKTANEEYTTSRATISDLRIGEIEQTNVQVKRGSQNRIGLGYLRQFKITFDLSSRKIYLKKGKRFGEIESDYHAGIALSRAKDKTIVSEMF
jgi:hypothetical protein